MLHELTHAMDRGGYTMIASGHLELLQAIIEGSAARGEGYYCDEKDYLLSFLYADDEYEVIAPHERNKEGTDYFYNSYLTFENLIDEHMNCLLGVEKMNEVKSRRGDTVYYFYLALRGEYGEELAGEIMKSFFLVSFNMREEDLYGIPEAEKRVSRLEEQIGFYESIAQAGTQERYAALFDAKIAAYENDIRLFRDNINELYYDPVYEYLDEKSGYIDTYEDATAMAKRYVEMSEECREIPYTDMVPFAKCIVESNRAVIDMLKRKGAGEHVVPQIILDFENVMNKAFVHRLQSEEGKRDPGGMNDLLQYYNWWVRVNVKEKKTGVDLTRENFDKVLAYLN